MKYKRAKEQKSYWVYGCSQYQIKYYFCLPDLVGLGSWPSSSFCNNILNCWHLVVLFMFVDLKLFIRCRLIYENAIYGLLQGLRTFNAFIIVNAYTGACISPVTTDYARLAAVMANNKYM